MFGFFYFHSESLNYKRRMWELWDFTVLSWGYFVVISLLWYLTFVSEEKSPIVEIVPEPVLSVCPAEEIFDENKIMIEGELMRRSLVGKVWQPRYFILKGNYLQYYENGVLIGGINIAGSSVQKIDEELCNRPFEFKIFSTARSWNFCASCKEDLEKWITAISKQIEFLQKRVKGTEKTKESLLMSSALPKQDQDKETLGKLSSSNSRRSSLSNLSQNVKVDFVSHTPFATPSIPNSSSPSIGVGVVVDIIRPSMEGNQRSPSIGILKPASTVNNTLPQVEGHVVGELKSGISSKGGKKDSITTNHGSDSGDSSLTPKIDHSLSENIDHSLSENTVETSSIASPSVVIPSNIPIVLSDSNSTNLNSSVTSEENISKCLNSIPPSEDGNKDDVIADSHSESQSKNEIINDTRKSIDISVEKPVVSDEINDNEIIQQSLSGSRNDDSRISVASRLFHSVDEDNRDSFDDANEFERHTELTDEDRELFSSKNFNVTSKEIENMLSNSLGDLREHEGLCDLSALELNDEISANSVNSHDVKINQQNSETQVVNERSNEESKNPNIVSTTDVLACDIATSCSDVSTVQDIMDLGSMTPYQDDRERVSNVDILSEEAEMKDFVDGSVERSRNESMDQDACYLFDHEDSEGSSNDNHDENSLPSLVDEDDSSKNHRIAAELMTRRLSFQCTSLLDGSARYVKFSRFLLPEEIIVTGALVGKEKLGIREVR